MQLKDLAAGLGISAAMVTKLKKRGMPTDSVEAAAKWRRRHLEPARTKGMRMELPRVIDRGAKAPAASGGHVSNSAAPDLVDARAAMALRQAHELGLLADDAIRRGTFPTVAPMLRQAMARVPVAARAHIALSMEVWDALTAEPTDAAGSDSADGDEGDLPDEFMETFWQQIALGEYTDMAITGWPGTAANPPAWTKK
jgi:hypothetical protein